MPSLIPRGHLWARSQQITGAAQVIMAGPVLYFGLRALNLQAAAITNVNVSDATASGGPLIDIVSLAAAGGGASDNRAYPIRTESGLFCDAGGAGNATILIYYLPLEYVASIGGVFEEDYFAETH